MREIFWFWCRSSNTERRSQGAAAELSASEVLAVVSCLAGKLERRVASPIWVSVTITRVFLEQPRNGGVFLVPLARDVGG